MKKIYPLLIFLLAINAFAFSQNEISYELIEYENLTYLDAELVENDTLQQLNLILPKKEEAYPLLLWIGGGAWSYVNRHMEMDLARSFAQRGIAVAAVGHRLSSALWRDSSMNHGSQHPDHIEDIAAAFKWLYDHAEEYGYDQQQVFVGGFSSGGHLAALLSLDERYLKKHGLSLQNIRGVIPISGAYDISNYHQAFVNGSNPDLADSHVKSVFGNTEAHFAQASPTAYLENLSVPMLIIADGNIDHYTAILEDAMLENGFSDFAVHYAHSYTHGDLWRSLAEKKSIYRQIILDFINKNVSS